MKAITNLSHCLKKVNNDIGFKIIVLVFLLFGIQIKLISQVLTAITAEGSSSTNSSTYVDVLGSSITIDVTIQLIQ